MPRELPLIRYSLRERGREFGIPRDNIDVNGIVEKINGRECQERVFNREMQGYYGHGIRVRLGLRPSAGGIIDGKIVNVLADLVTTYLRGYSDGTIEHKTELCDTDGGIKAGIMWDNKVGGFSSAIDLNTNMMWGFDYVPNPNYVNNSYKGIALDSADAISLETIDALILGEHTDAWLLLLNQKQVALDMANAALEQTVGENEDLLALLNGYKSGREDNPFLAMAAFDCAEQLQRNISEFNSLSVLPQLHKTDKTQTNAEQVAYRNILNGLLAGRG
ncbi:hypothetical protein KFZ76_07020 [Methylovulum psychrotolerans]|uniref:hypothetical protein n=1 Tax=Methylovulum psychrotolerans TaxID=1704499 RepID=UPI001BFFB205|nr:hypothetical protein [Methylovulum psychrotolerans]MBT9097462.1 hypothetical protein [Methylovulum psychrotolerans]